MVRSASVGLHQLVRISVSVGLPEPQLAKDALVELLLSAGEHDAVALGKLKIQELQKQASQLGIDQSAVRDALLLMPGRDGQIAADAANEWLAARIAHAHGSQGIVDLCNTSLGTGGTQVLSTCLAASSLHGVQCLHLGNCGLDDAALGAFAGGNGVPSAIIQLTDLDLSSNSFGLQGLQAIVQPGSGFGTNLAVLNLSNNPQLLRRSNGGRVATPGHALGAAVAASQLRELHLAHCALGPHGAAALANSLVEHGGLPLSLNILVLSGNPLTGSGELVEGRTRAGTDDTQRRGLRRLRKDRIDYDTSGFEALCALLKHSHVRLLKLEQCGLGTRAGAALGSAGLGMHLQELDLGHNALRCSGVTQLAHSLADSTLTSLSLRDNQLGAPALMALHRGYLNVTKERARVGSAVGGTVEGKFRGGIITLKHLDLGSLLMIPLGDDLSLQSPLHTNLEPAAAVASLLPLLPMLESIVLQLGNVPRFALTDVSELHLNSRALSSSECLLLGAWLKRSQPQTLVEKLVLSHNNGLHEVVLGLQGGGNEIHLRGFQMLCDSLQTSCVQVLELNSCNLGPECVKILAKSLPVSIKHLNIASNPLKTEGLSALSEAFRGENGVIFDITNLQIDLGAQHRDLNALSTSIILSQQSLTPDDLVLLAGWMQMPTVRANLCTIDLAHNSLVKHTATGSEVELQGIQGLARALPSLTRLQKLSISDTGLGPVAMHLLSPSFPQQLQSLDLSNNSLGVAGKAMLAVELPLLCIQILIVDLGNCSDPSARSTVLDAAAPFLNLGVSNENWVSRPDPDTTAAQIGSQITTTPVNINRRRSTTVILTGNAKLDAIARNNLDLGGTRLDPKAMRAPHLQPEDALILAGWLNCAKVRKSLTDLDLSGNTGLVDRHLSSGDEVDYNGPLFEGEIAEQLFKSKEGMDLRYQGANQAILTDQHWTDDHQNTWSEDKRKAAVASGMLRWACQSSAPQAWAADPGVRLADRPAGLATNSDWCTHWCVAFDALACAISSLYKLRALRLRGIGLGHRALTLLARRGIGTALQELDLAENPLIRLDWQGRELAQDTQSWAGLMCRATGNKLPEGWCNLRSSAPELHDTTTPGVTVLRLQHTNIGPIALQELVSVTNTRLTKLFLGRNSALGNSGKAVLAEGIVKRQLLSLKLLEIDFGRMPAIELSAGCTSLDLSSQQLTNGDACLLGAAIGNGELCAGLHTLHLSDNPAIAASGKLAIAAGLATPSSHPVAKGLGGSGAPVLVSASFGIGGKTSVTGPKEVLLSLHAGVESLCFRGCGIQMADVALIAACLSPQQRQPRNIGVARDLLVSQTEKHATADKKSSGKTAGTASDEAKCTVADSVMFPKPALGLTAGLKTIDLGANYLTDHDIIPLFCALSVAEAQRQINIAAKVQQDALDADIAEQQAKVDDEKARNSIDITKDPAERQEWITWRKTTTQNLAQSQKTASKLRELAQRRAVLDKSLAPLLAGLARIQRGHALSVHDLRLDKNRLGPLSGESLGNILTAGQANDGCRPPPLKLLNLSGNNSFCDVGLEMLAPSLGQPACLIESLDVSDCGICYRKRAVRRAAKGISDSLSHVPGVLELAAAVQSRPFSLIISTF